MIPPETLKVELLIARRPAEVRAWWTEYPDDYVANDPAEQPFRIRTLGRAGGKREVLTSWRLPDGSAREVPEFLENYPDGSWVYEIPHHPLGLHIRDIFEVSVAPGGGSRLLITSVVTPLTPGGEKNLRPQLARMEAAWRRCVAICERDAPLIEEAT
ncbi:MAG: hypothetical protein ACYDCK_14560 [Thermoplasmatota archaeon]